jgi:xylulokinase
MNSVFLSIDLGTTGLKVSILSENGLLLAQSSRLYPIDTPWRGAAEQNSEFWWNALTACCHDLRIRAEEPFSRISGVGICGQMHSHVYLGADGNPLRSAITWMDQRSVKLLERLEAESGFSDYVFEHTCNSPAPTYTAPNCLWVQEEQPEIWEATHSVLIAKDYLKYRLTGEMVTDYSDAAGTLLFDVAKQCWSQEMLSLFKIDRSFLPDAVPSNIIIGHVSTTAAAATGITVGTPVTNGSSDNSAAALGCGMVDSGQATLIIGTAGVVSVCSDRPVPDSRHRLACWNYCLEDRWVSLGVTQTAGESLNWFKRCFEEDGKESESEDVFQEYEEAASAAPMGAGGLVFLPYLNGERTPYWDSYARGVFFGVNLETKKSHFIRAIMEGVSFALRNNLETIESLGLHVDEVRATGGGLRSKTWMGLLSQILGKPVRKVSARDPGNDGNAMLCGMALGVYDSVDSAKASFVQDGPDQIMEVESNEVAERNYHVFLQLYEDLKYRFRMAVE